MLQRLWMCSVRPSLPALAVFTVVVSLTVLLLSWRNDQPGFVVSRHARAYVDAVVKTRCHPAYDSLGRKTLHVINLRRMVYVNSRNWFLEQDWMRLEMFQALDDHVVIFVDPPNTPAGDTVGGGESIFCNNSIIVVFNTDTGVESDKYVLNYLAEANRQGVHVLGGVHLADEHPDCDMVGGHRSWYNHVSFVFRAYWSKAIEHKYPRQVEWHMLGWKSGFGPISPQEILPSSARQIYCSFIGTVNGRRRRVALLKAVQRDERCLFIGTRSFESPSNMDMLEYRYQVLNSAITLCPAGHNRESFRIYEALEAGSIPVIDAGNTIGIEFHDQERCSGGDNDSFVPYDFGNGCPLPVVTDWERDLPVVLNSLANPTVLDDLQERVMAWFAVLKLRWQQKVRQRIEAAEGL